MYTAEQIEKAMTRYYQDFLDNPEAYDENFDSLIPSVDAKRVVDILVTFMEENN